MDGPPVTTSAMAMADSTAVFQEALALLDEFYAVDGIELLPEPWYGKLEPLPMTQSAGVFGGGAAIDPLSEATLEPLLMDDDNMDMGGDDDTKRPMLTTGASASIASSTTSSSSGPGTPASTSSSSSSSSASQPRRNRQREELLRLRQEAVDLEQRLFEIKQRHQDAAAAAEAMTPEEREMVALWEKIATRQQGERQRSEVENTKLKELLSAQTRVAHELRRLMDKQSKAQNAMPGAEGGDRSKARRLVPLHELPDLATFQELIRGLEPAYKKVDAVFHASGLDAVTAPFRTTQLKLDEHVGVRVEMLGKSLLPFPMEELAEAIWAYTKNGGMPLHHYFYDQAETPEDLLVRFAGIRAPNGTSMVDMQGKHASHRFREPTRTVMTWEAQLEPQTYSGTPTTDIRFRESGWVMIKSSSTPGASEILMLRVITPVVPPGTNPSSDWRIYALIDFVSNVILTQGTAMKQRVENYLLENALRRQGSNSSSNKNSNGYRAPPDVAPDSPMR